MASLGQILWRIGWAAVEIALAFALAGCDSDGACDTVCAKGAECGEVDDEGACVELCEDLSEANEYAEAIETQAECYEDKTCGAIQAGSCTIED